MNVFYHLAIKRRDVKDEWTFGNECFPFSIKRLDFSGANFDVCIVLEKEERKSKVKEEMLRADMTWQATCDVICHVSMLLMSLVVVISLEDN